MSELQSALVAAMEALVRLHDDADHDYLNECDCEDAAAFRQANVALRNSGIDFERDFTTQPV